MISKREQLTFSSLEDVESKLISEGCRICSLGFQMNPTTQEPIINGCCVTRGSKTSTLMIVGEAPGKDEDSTRKPFTGPAGQLLDKIWHAAGMSTNDWYLTNVVKCRPVAKGIGKENYTPRSDQIKLCSPILSNELWHLKPKLVVTLGRTATERVLRRKVPSMGASRGRFFQLEINYPEIYNPLAVPHCTRVFPMIHPAAILHATGTPKCDEYKQLTWNDVRLLKQTIEEEGLNVR